MAAPGSGGRDRASCRDGRVLGDRRASPAPFQRRQPEQLHRSQFKQQRAPIGTPRLATRRRDSVERVRAQFVATGIEQLPLELASAQHAAELGPDPVVEPIAERLVVTEPVAAAEHDAEHDAKRIADPERLPVGPSVHVQPGIHPGDSVGAGRGRNGRQAIAGSPWQALAAVRPMIS